MSTKPPARPAVAVAAALTLLTTAGLAPAAGREGPWILNDWPAARAEARRDCPPDRPGKPIFAVFRCPH